MISPFHPIPAINADSARAASLASLHHGEE